MEDMIQKETSVENTIKIDRINNIYRSVINDVGFFDKMTNNIFLNPIIGKLSMIFTCFIKFYKSSPDSFYDNNDIYNMIELYYNIEYELDGISRDKQEYKEKMKRLLDLTNDLSQESINIFQYKIIDDFYSKMEHFKKALDNYKEKAEKISVELDEKQKLWKISSFSGSFQDIAVEERDAKIVWLVASCVTFVAAMGFVFWNAYVLISNEFGVSMLEFLQKITITFFLYGMAYWLGRRYYFCRTQEVAYRHMAAILNVYDIFKDSAKKNSDSNEKNIILTEMAHAVFAPPLIPNIKNIPSSDWAKMIDLMKILASQKGNSSGG